MTPGRKLDALVAEKVMGISPYWTVMFGGSFFGNFATQERARHRAKEIQGDFKAQIIPYHEEPGYSTDISAAWEVVEKFTKEAELKGTGPIFDVCYDGTWHCSIGRIVTQAETAAHAICLAALSAVGHLPKVSP
jgi:hypothetical protein